MVVKHDEGKRVRKLSSADLEKKLTELKKDLFQLRLQHATNQLENPVRISEVSVTLPESKPSSVSSSSLASKEERNHA